MDVIRLLTVDLMHILIDEIDIGLIGIVFNTTGMRKEVFDFNGLQIKKSGVKYLLEAGEIIQDLPESFGNLALAPKTEENGKAVLAPKTIKITSDEMSILGRIEWPLPFIVKFIKQIQTRISRFVSGCKRTTRKIRFL